MSSEQVQPIPKETIKLLMLGDSGVGKSSLMIRFINATFSPQMMGTTGVDMREKIMKIQDEWYKIQIWDTAGQERFHSISRNYYRGAHGIILVYEVNDRASFVNLPNWLDDIRKNTDFVHILLVGNKIDLKGVISEDEGKRLASENQIPTILTSAKDDKNVTDAFFNLINVIIQRGIVKKPKNRTIRDRDNIHKKSCC